MSKKGEIVFHEGDEIIITDEQLAKRYGEGPFSVVDIEWVGFVCTCGATHRYQKKVNFADHEDHCNIRRRKEMGHSQIVTISTSEGPVSLSGADINFYC